MREGAGDGDARLCFCWMRHLQGAHGSCKEGTEPFGAQKRAVGPRWQPQKCMLKDGHPTHPCFFSVGARNPRGGGLGSQTNLRSWP